MTRSNARIAVIIIAILLLLGGVAWVTVSVLQHLNRPEHGPRLLSTFPQDPVASEDRAPFGRLEYRGAVTRDDLRTVCNVVISADGRHLYAAAFEANTILAFHRDAGSGALEHLQSIQDPGHLGGVTWLQISPDDCSLVTGAFRSGAVSLFMCNTKSGELELLNVVSKNDPDMVGLEYPTRADFSRDGKHVYVLDGSDGGITTLAVGEGGRFERLQTLAGDGGCLAGSRGVAMLPDGHALAIACFRANTLVLLDRDPDSGRTEVRQVVRDEEDGVHSLAGAFGAACSSDGKSVYVCCGRFRGDHAVCAFQLTAEGRLVLIQEFTDQDQLQPFRGGNKIVVSPDDRNVYATATISGSVACFERDLTNGRLRYVEMMTDDPSIADLKGAAGICCSPDGRFVYVAAEFEKTIAVYERVGVK